MALFWADIEREVANSKMPFVLFSKATINAGTI